MAKHDNSQKGYSLELYLNYIEYRVIIELIIVIDDNSHIGYSIVLNIYIKLIMAIHNNNSIVHIYIYNYIYIKLIMVIDDNSQIGYSIVLYI